ncbi:IclR family transcriptional regulator [Actinomadura nitritigenes]|uniref:IclR family transcriptional regulator n=1 Tax=Actinomadura nitritigenes TaxID=134602 RepID=UPI003D8C9137
MEDQRYSAPAAACAAQIMRLLARQDEPCSVPEMARRLGLTKSLVFRVVSELSRHDLLERQSDARYALGFGVLELGAAMVTRNDLAAACVAILDRLAATVTETANLATLRDNDVVYLMKREGPNSRLTISHVGSRLPANCSALGKALLSTLPDDDLDAHLAQDLPRLTERSITDAGRLREQIISARSAGWIVEEGESVLGRCCVAAPVRVGHVRLAVSASVAEPRMASQKEDIIVAVTHARDQLEARIRARTALSGDVSGMLGQSGSAAG